MSSLRICACRLASPALSAVILLGCCGPAYQALRPEAAMAVGKNRANEPAWVAEYPLWRAVPTSRFAVLGEGVVRTTRWGIYAYRPKGRNGAGRPCLEEVNLSFKGLYHDGASCGPLAPPAKMPVFTLSGSSYQYEGHREVGEAVLGMALAPTVRRVMLELSPGPPVTRLTRQLSPRQAQKAEVEPFRYVTVTRPRDVCLRGVTAYDLAGNEVLSTPRNHCTVQ